MKIHSINVRKGKYRTTYLPGFILRIKGKLDSRKGERAVIAFKERLIYREGVFENYEYLLAESILKDERNEAAKALFSLDYLEPVENDGSKVASKKNMAIGSVKTQAKEKIVTTHEFINHIHSLFEERTQRIRNYTSTKLEQYFAGVTLDGFDKTYTYSDEAKTRYLKHHERGDEAIKTFAEKTYYKEANDNEAV